MKSTRRSHLRIYLAIFAAALISGLAIPASRAAEPTLQLKDNDVWVMAGDSITAQRQHTNYIEAYYRTRLSEAESALPQFGHRRQSHGQRARALRLRRGGVEADDREHRTRA